MGDGFGQLEVPSCAPHRAGASRARLVRARSRPSWGRQVSPFLRLPGASPHAWMPSVSPFLRLPGASPHAWMPSVSPDDLMFGPTFSDFLPLVRRRFGGSGTRMDVRSAVLVGSFRAARLPARYNFSRDPRWISVDLIGVSHRGPVEKGPSQGALGAFSAGFGKTAPLLDPWLKAPSARGEGPPSKGPL